MVSEIGADAVGLIFAPTSKRCVSLDVAQAITREVGSTTQVIGVFRGQEEAAIVSLVDGVGLSAVQLHDEPSQGLMAILRTNGVSFIIRAMPAHEAREVDESLFDAVLLDASMPGSGIVAQWREMPQRSWQRPVIIAGGLHGDNVADLVRQLSPWGVDGASGTESVPGVKDREKVASFVGNARRALRMEEDR